MSNLPKLMDVRQIGPGSERNISGLCSACGTTLLARLKSNEPVDAVRLRENLEAVFQQHLMQKHSTATELIDL